MSSGGPLGPSVWAVSDGRAGNAAQVRAIVGALSDTRRWMRVAHIADNAHRDKPITLEPGRPWTLLPARFWALQKGALPPEQKALLQGPWPTIWIGAGRRTAPYSAAVRRWSKGKTYVVHVLDPKIPASKFDLMVTPAHDGREARNILPTIGSPTYFPQDVQEDAGLAFGDLADEPGRSVIVILGGKSKTYRFTSEDADRLMEQLRGAAGLGWRLRITTSRRTPVEIVARMRSFADEVGARFWAGPMDGDNPYLAWLLFSDAAIVSEDSANMLSDAAYHGLPIHMARLTGGSPKFRRFHESLIARGCARWFEGDLGTWTYEPLREADRVADRIVEDVLKRYPQPTIPEIDVTKVNPPSWF